MEGKQPLISIIITSYNHGAYIKQAVDSALGQTYKNIEILIVDDGSRDNTHEILQKEYGTEPRIKLLLNKDNRGYAYRANECINLARGEFICFLSSDDWYLPEKTAKQVEKFNTLDNSYGVVYSAGSRYYEKDKRTLPAGTNDNMRSGWILKELLTEPFFIYPITPMIRKECLVRYPYTDKYKAEGEAIYFKIAMKYKFEFVNETLVVMRDHDYNTGKNILMMAKDNIMYREDLFSHPDFPKNLQYLKNQVISQIYFLKGWEMIRINKNYKEGRTALLNAIRYNKKYLLNARALVGLAMTSFSGVTLFNKNKN